MPGVAIRLPDRDQADLQAPDAREVAVWSRWIADTAAAPGGLSPLQRLLVEAVIPAMTGHPAVLDGPPFAPGEFEGLVARRDLVFRSRVVQIAVLAALVLRPIPPEVVERVAQEARRVGVDDAMLRVAQQFAAGSLGLAAVDFERNGYTATWHPDDASALHTSRALADAWEQVVDDPGLAARWAALETLPPATLGRRVSEFYRARGFTYPGLPGSAPPLLAQHDWVHVLADFGTTVESELEVFAFIARANDDLHAFSLLAMVVSLFETGYLRTGAGLFQSDVGHLSRSGVATRVADAMRRGALCAGSVDYLRIDWFEFAELEVAAARGHFGVGPKGAPAMEVGSPGPWERGGISPFQVAAGQAHAASEGRPYDAFGAEALT